MADKSFKQRAMHVSQPLLDWYQKNKRDLPWRHTQDPYIIWLSEIILQQTRVDQGLDYFLKFTQTFPTVHDLAKAPEDQVMKLWQGLGYYSRARNLHATAKHISENLDGNFPPNYKGLLELKGVGNYTAAAIASFAFGEKKAVLDGNVYRVLARLHGIDTPIDSNEGKKGFQTLADELIDPNEPGEFNQAIMEFGATHCTPKQPKCDHCIFAPTCVALAEGRVNELPVKGKKTAVKELFFNYLFLHDQGHTYIKKREQAGIWRNLYEFPLLETESRLSEQDLLNSESWQKLMTGSEYTIEKVSGEFKHILSHRRIYARFWDVTLKTSASDNLKSTYQRIPLHTLESYAIPRLIDKYLIDKKKEVQIGLDFNFD